MKEEANEDTAQLDKDWTAIHSLLVPKLKPIVNNAPRDTYDRDVKSLMFEAKAQPTDRLKGDEELAKYGFKF